jgi:hypothetical protein
MTQLSNDQAVAVMRQGVEALQKGRAAEARQHFEAVIATGRQSTQLWLLLATACRMDKDAAAEEAVLDRLLATEPKLVRALIMKADCRAKAGDDPSALAFYNIALQHARGQQLPADLTAELQRAQAEVARYHEQLIARRDAGLTALGLPPENRSRRFQQSLDILSGAKRIYVQEPTGYYFPGLPQIQFFDTAEFDWVPAVEAATDAILAELNAYLAAGTKDFRPYIQTDPNKPRGDENHLLDSPDWSALFLVENGKRAEDITARFPATWEAAQAVPWPRAPNSPTAMFSLLRPGARIAPHTGTFNTRLICHLPLIVPPNCRFRVGNEVREWEVGKLLIFDDTIEHEAWNDSGEDRVVLIFDIWRPELDEREQNEIAALFAGVGLS